MITKIYIFVKGTISVANTATPDTDANNTNWKVTFKKCSPFEKGITEINNTQVDNAWVIGSSGSLFQYCRDEPALYNTGYIILSVLLTIILLIHLVLKKK